MRSYKEIAGLIVISLLVISALFTGMVSATTAEDTQTKESGQLENNYYFGLYPHDQHLIERYGSLPSLETEGQKENWTTNLEELSDTIKDDFAAKYLYPYGDVVTCGSNSDGYFVILLLNKTIDKQQMDEIYSFMNDAASNQNIQNLPVEFGYGDYGGKIMGNTFYLAEPELQATSDYLKSGKDITVRKGVPALAVYGEAPKWNNMTEFDEWWSTLVAIKDNSTEQIIQLGEMNDYAIVSHGIRSNGKFIVRIHKDLPLEEKMRLVNETYQIIDEEARKINVVNVPVVFEESEYEQLAEEVVEEEIVVKNETTNQTSNTVPGFSVVTSIGVISLLLLSKKYL